MKAMQWMLAILILLTAFGLTIVACSGDDDDDDDDSYTCEDFCEKAAECGTGCIPGDCLAYCAEDLTQADLACTALPNCDQFYNCVCTGDDDDDNDDNDTGDDDDNDTGDDDTGDDDDDILESYIYDDGTDEYSEGDSVNGDIFVIEVIPSGYPAFLTEVSVYVTELFASTNDFQFVVVADPNGDGPETSEIVFTSENIEPDVKDQWYNLDLTTTSFSSYLASGNWYVGVKSLHTTAAWWGIDTSVDSPPCYLGPGNPWMETQPRGGIYMIRAEGYYQN